MHRVNTRFWTCIEGHVTAGIEATRSKCTASMWEYNYVEGKKRGKYVVDKKDKKQCGKEIIAPHGIEIPEVLDFDSIWDETYMHAFLIDQKIDADYMLFIQRSFHDLSQRLKALEGAQK